MTKELMDAEYKQKSKVKRSLSSSWVVTTWQGPQKEDLTYESYHAPPNCQTHGKKLFPKPFLETFHANLHKLKEIFPLLENKSDSFTA